VPNLVESLQKTVICTLQHLIQTVVNESEGVALFGSARDPLAEQFITHINSAFDELSTTQPKKSTTVDFDSLSLVQEDELNTMVATRGMIAAARNKNLPDLISFNTRLSAVIEIKQIDESSNPLDPQQLSTAFSAAMLKVDCRAKNDLAAYRRFNEVLLKQLDTVLQEANQMLIKAGVMPDLRTETATHVARGATQSRSKARPQLEMMDSFGGLEALPADSESDNPELFGMMQNLLRPAARGVSAANAASQQFAVPSSMIHAAQTAGLLSPANNETVVMVGQQELFDILTNIQQSLKIDGARSAGSTNEITNHELEKLDVPESINELLLQTQELGKGKANAVDQQSADIISLVSLLYEAIWQDNSVALPIKELIGRTQITILKVALSDTTFFNRENHPARSILNEFASAAIGWTEVRDLENDSLYQKMNELVSRMLIEYTDDIELFNKLLKDFRLFRARLAAKTHHLEQRIMRANEREERIEDIRELADQKIAERILGRDLPAFIQDFLGQIYHKFMVMLLLKEGPGSNAWKQSINTIDVLLWTVQPKDHADDRPRLDTVNPRLLNNLRKALRITKLDSLEIDRLMAELTIIQEASFAQLEQGLIADTGDARFTGDAVELQGTSSEGVQPARTNKQAAIVEDIDEDDPHMQAVDRVDVGDWFEFLGEADLTTRCKLAAKIKVIDKYIFVTQQGVKVVEKTRAGLARELKDGTVKLISNGLLFSRALESVIGNLRASQQEQSEDAFQRPLLKEAPEASLAPVAPSH